MTKARLITVVVLGVLVLVVVHGSRGWTVAGQPVPVASPADCLKFSPVAANDVDLEQVDCDYPDAVYRAGARLDNASADCPSDSYEKYTPLDSRGPAAVCLMLNAKVGDCFADFTATGDLTRRVSCSADDAQVKVTDVVVGRAAGSACPADTGLALVYPAPGETVCVAQVTEGT